MTTDRSHISEHALTLDELRKLAHGTRIAFYNADSGDATLVSLTHVDTEKVYGRRIADGIVTDEIVERYHSDMGLVPLAGGSAWNTANCTVLAEHIGDMPKPSPARRPGPHWDEW